MRLGKQRNWISSDREELLPENNVQLANPAQNAFATSDNFSSDNESLISLADEPVPQKK